MSFNKEFVKERLMVAADDISDMFDRAIASYEEELSRTREENERQRQQLEAISKNQAVQHTEDVQQMAGRQEQLGTQTQAGSSALKQEEDPQPPHVKEEEEEL